MKIITVPQPILNQKTKPVKKIDGKIQSLVKAMVKTLEAQTDPPGVGLAAPQVGENLSLFIIKPTKKSKPEVFINPKIIKLINSPTSLPDNKKNSKIPLEGCLSIPRIWGVVNRANKVLLEYHDLKGQKKTEWFSGFKAIIIQHEMDHLNGILFTQRVIEQKKELFEERDGQLKKINSLI